MHICVLYTLQIYGLKLPFWAREGEQSRFRGSTEGAGGSSEEARGSTKGAEGIIEGAYSNCSHVGYDSLSM